MLLGGEGKDGEAAHTPSMNSALALAGPRRAVT